MDNFYKAGPAVFRLRDFSIETPFSVWQWKLDPFKIHSEAEMLIDIAMMPSEFDFSDKKLLFEKPDGFYTHRVWEIKDGFIWDLLRNKNDNVLISFTSDKAFKNIRFIEDKTDSFGQTAFEMLSRPFLYALISSGILTFHGVLMEFNGCGIIISAPSGTGKTTHARLWRDTENALIINGDNACCYKNGDTWTGFGIPWSGTSGESINRQVPIKALVILEQAKENKAEVLSEYSAFKNAFSVIQHPYWETELTKKAFDLFEDFTKEIPVIKLDCRPDEDAVKTLKSALEGII